MTSSTPVPLARTALLALLLLLAPTSALAQSRPRTPVSPYAPHVSFAAALSLGLAAGLTLGDPTPAPRWGGNPFDDAVRDGLRLPDRSGRIGAGLASDALVLGLVAFVGGIDGLLVPLLEGDDALAWQATAAFALTLGLTVSLDELVKVAAARARPLTVGCDPGADPSSCTPPSPGMSFYSGHSAVAFASAGFSCAMHLERAQYGDDAADGVVCGSTLAAAAVVGLLRVLADQHYLTDVLAGAALGFVTGYVMPLLFVPRRSTATHAGAGAALAVLPTGTLDARGLGSLGLQAAGTF